MPACRAQARQQQPDTLGLPGAAPASDLGPSTSKPLETSSSNGSSSNGSGSNGSNGNGGAVNARTDYGALSKSDYSKFVQFFRQASPYIEGHRGRIFVIVVPGEVRSACVRPLGGVREQTRVCAARGCTRLRMLHIMPSRAVEKLAEAGLHGRKGGFVHM